MRIAIDTKLRIIREGRTCTGFIIYLSTLFLLMSCMRFCCKFCDIDIPSSISVNFDCWSLPETLAGNPMSFNFNVNVIYIRRHNSPSVTMMKQRPRVAMVIFQTHPCVHVINDVCRCLQYCYVPRTLLTEPGMFGPQGPYPRWPA